MSKKMVMVGCKTLSAGIVKADDPIKRGDVLELSGRALEYAENKTYNDALGNTHQMFVEADSAAGKRVISEVTGVPLAEAEGGTVRKRRTRAVA